MVTERSYISGTRSDSCATTVLVFSRRYLMIMQGGFCRFRNFEKVCNNNINDNNRFLCSDFSCLRLAQTALQFILLQFYTIYDN